MRPSRYFSDLGRAYSDEIDDLLTDSDGRTVLRQRLDVKRRQFADIVPMIEFSPEMVAVAFYDAFRFGHAASIGEIAQREPGQPGFPRWSDLCGRLGVADWAQPLVAAALKADGGDVFLVTTATLEYLRLHGRGGVTSTDELSESSEPSAQGEGDDPTDDGDDEAHDLAEAGADWLAEQGFETPNQ